MQASAIVWSLVLLLEALVWNVPLPGFSNHLSMYERMSNIKPWIEPVSRLVSFSALLPVVAFSSNKRWAMIMTLIFPGLPYLLGPLYNFWIPWIFGCCGFWYHGAGQNLSVEEGLRKFQHDFKVNHRILPLIEGHPIFVDTEHTLLTVLVIVAWILSLHQILNATRKIRRNINQKID